MVQVGNWCLPGDEANAYPCYNPFDGRDICGGEALSFWKNRNGDIFLSTSDCGPPGYEEVSLFWTGCD